MQFENLPDDVLRHISKDTPCEDGIPIQWEWARHYNKFVTGLVWCTDSGIIERVYRLLQKAFPKADFTHLTKADLQSLYAHEPQFYQSGNFSAISIQQVPQEMLGYYNSQTNKIMENLKNELQGRAKTQQRGDAALTTRTDYQKIVKSWFICDAALKKTNKAIHGVLSFGTLKRKR